MSKYEIFIQGETMDLCVPNEKAVLEDGWGSWFNDPKTTRYIDQGIFPNTTEDQKVIMRKKKPALDSLAVLIPAFDIGMQNGTATPAQEQMIYDLLNSLGE